MRNVTVEFLGQYRKDAWFLGGLSFGLWGGRLIWFLCRHLGQQIDATGSVYGGQK